MGKSTKSKLPGWSPSGEIPKATRFESDGKFSIGPSAAVDTAPSAAVSAQVQDPSTGSEKTTSDGSLLCAENRPKEQKKAKQKQKQKQQQGEYKKLPKLSKAERRAKQEAQRARKAALKAGLPVSELDNKGNNSKKGQQKGSGASVVGRAAGAVERK